MKTFLNLYLLFEIKIKNETFFLQKYYQKTMFSTELYYEHIDLCIMFITENISYHTDNLSVYMYDFIKIIIKNTEIDDLKKFIKIHLDINHINDITEIQLLYEQKEGHTNYTDEHHYYICMVSYIIYNKLYESHYNYFKDIIDERIRDHEEEMRTSKLIDNMYCEEYENDIDNEDDEEDEDDEANEWLRDNDRQLKIDNINSFDSYQINKLDNVFNNLNTYI